MRTVLIVTALLAALALPSQAQDFGAGLKAYNVGDYASAAHQWRLLARRNDGKAQAGLGFLYYKGLGVRQNNAEAAKWFHKAARQGQVTAQLFLGMMYLHGDGVPQSFVLAHMWCDVGVANGSADALECRDLVSDNMTAAEVTEAQQLAVDWLNRHRAD